MIDPDTPSKLLVTTRIRGLVEGAAEVSIGSLSEAEALDLLAATAGIKREVLEEDQAECGRAVQVVNMCGRLALTVTIAGGMVSASGGLIDEDFVELLQEEGLGGEEDDEEESEMSVEDRVIKSSLTMIEKKKNSGMIHAIFDFFAVFPEDTPVPTAVFVVLAPCLTGGAASSKKGIMLLKKGLTTLLDCE